MGAPPVTSKSATNDVEALWFECTEDAGVVRCGPGLEHLGIRPGAAVAAAATSLAAACDRTIWRGLGRQRWRCEAQGTPQTSSPLADCQLQLERETRRRRMLERRLLAVSEDEHRRLSLELHDGLGQHLSGLAYQARSLADRLNADQHALQQEADWMARLLKDAVGRVRALSRGLWPVSLERESLPQALGALARDIEQLYGIEIQVLAKGFMAESGHSAHHLFRIAQEAMHNAVKHARARRITVRLELVPPQAMLSIVNDGLPLDPKRMHESGGLGLMGMRLRADALGGEISVESLADGGTEVCLVWTPSAYAGAHAEETDS